MSYGEKVEESLPTIRDGLSVLRFAFAANMQALSFARHLSNEFGGQDMLVRPLQPSSVHDLAQANVRLCHTLEISERFREPFIEERRADLAFVISEILRIVPSLRDDTTVTLEGAHYERKAGYRMCVAALLDADSQKRMQAEREEVLSAMKTATRVKRTAWEERPFELILATTDLDAGQGRLQTMANMIASACPIEVKLGPTGFEPQPSSMSA